MKVNFKHLVLLPLLFSLGLLGGCAAPAKVTSMTVMPAHHEVAGNNSALKNKVIVSSVTGGEETNPMWTSEIDSAGFKKALEDSLKFAGLADMGQSAASYRLETQLLSVNQPLVGFDMTVTVVAAYKLYNAANEKLVWSKQYSSPYTATVSDAFVGFQRLQLANEGSAKANIKMLVDHLLQMEKKDL